MKRNLLFFALFSCFALSSFALPGKAEEGSYCGFEYPPGIHCKEGLACDRRGSEDPWGGICRKPCHEDSECKRNQYCEEGKWVRFCVEQ